ncbi:hypothetical protein [Sphingobium herbicidovorans]|uniref:hypothetical protein n=1 Tax=Sphingobium herbicidovorans TaxID=76947 RepID=UPI0022AFE833|nr:hypothetical protein [Sphingobium herbicidovorans]
MAGFAGSGADGDEAGLVHFAVARRNGETVRRVEHFRDIRRGHERIKSLRVALEMMGKPIKTAEKLTSLHRYGLVRVTAATPHGSVGEVAVNSGAVKELGLPGGRKTLTFGWMNWPPRQDPRRVIDQP